RDVAAGSAAGERAQGRLADPGAAQRRPDPAVHAQRLHPDPRGAGRPLRRRRLAPGARGPQRPHQAAVPLGAGEGRADRLHEVAHKRSARRAAHHPARPPAIGALPAMPTSSPRPILSLLSLAGALALAPAAGAAPPKAAPPPPRPAPAPAPAADSAEPPPEEDAETIPELNEKIRQLETRLDQ